MHTITNYINGEHVEPASGEYLENVDPSTGEVYSRCPDSDERDVDRAFNAAQTAFPAWSGMPAGDRSRVMVRLADLVEENLYRLAEAECIDNGKPMTLAKSVDIPRAAANLRFFATAILHTNSESFFTEGGVQGARAINYTLRQPRGVAGCISPWNLPLYLFTWKIAPALATGNTVVAKPSEITPMTAHLLGELCEQAEMPPGVLNIVHGQGSKAGAAIVAHPGIPAISFTGGTATGESIARTAGPMFKKLSLELGGKNPTIVFADADLQQAIEMSVTAAFANQGEICLCGSRVFVERSIHEAFVDTFVDAASRLRVGDPLEPETQQGALVSQAHLEKVQSYIDLAREEGGTIACGGQPPPEGTLPKRCANGFFLQPTVVTGLDASCRTNQEEIFGPVASVIPFDDEDEVVHHANSTKYGLAASIWTGDVNCAHRVAERIDAGTVWINCWMLRDLRVPFGGMKSSGVGREGGEEALRFFTEAKNVCVRMAGPSTDSNAEPAADQDR